MKEVLFLNFGSNLGKDILKNVYQKLELQHCYVIDYLPTSFAKDINVKKTLDHYYITRGCYPEEINQFPPLNSTLLKEMSHVETVVLKMIDRLYTETYSYQERKEMYLNHLRYWDHFLRNFNIDCVVLPNYPHEMYDFVICHLCERYNIDYYCLATLPIVKNRFFLHKNFFKNDSALKNVYVDIESNWSEVKNKMSLTKEFSFYWETINKNKSMQVPFYMKSNLKKRNVIKDSKNVLLKFLEVNKLFKRIVYRLSNIKKQLSVILKNRELKKFYTKNCQLFNKDEDYIYLGLHYQPELTTCPLGGVFVDQILMVQTLSKALPKHIKIYLKEHPTQWRYLSRGRSLKFYDDLLKMDNVVLLHPNTNSFDLSINALAVATVSGTVGWEALFYGIPTLIFGDAFYKYSKGVYQIKRLEDCQRAIRQIMTEGKLSSTFLKCICIT